MLDVQETHDSLIRRGLVLELVGPAKCCSFVTSMDAKTSMDAPAATCFDCGGPGAVIELASGEGLICARCFARRYPAVERDANNAGARGVHWSDADRAAWRETAALAGQSAMAAECVCDALAARGVTYRGSATWVWEHGPAYADICVACDSAMPRSADHAMSVERWAANDARSRRPRSAASTRG